MLPCYNQLGLERKSVLLGAGKAGSPHSHSTRAERQRSKRSVERYLLKQHSTFHNTTVIIRTIEVYITCLQYLCIQIITKVQCNFKVLSFAFQNEHHMANHPVYYTLHTFKITHKCSMKTYYLSNVNYRLSANNTVAPTGTVVTPTSLDELCQLS